MPVFSSSNIDFASYPFAFSCIFNIRNLDNNNQLVTLTAVTDFSINTHNAFEWNLCIPVQKLFLWIFRTVFIKKTNPSGDVLNSFTDLPNPFRDLPNPFRELPNPFRGFPNSFRGFPNSFGELPNLFRGFPNLFGELPNPFRGLPNSFRGLPNILRELPDLFG